MLVELGDAFKAFVALLGALSTQIAHDVCEKTTDIVAHFRENNLQPVLEYYYGIDPSEEHKQTASTVFATITSTVTPTPTVTFTTTTYAAGHVAVVASPAPRTPIPDVFLAPEVCFAPLAWANLENLEVCISEDNFNRLSDFATTFRETPMSRLVLRFLEGGANLLATLWDIITFPIPANLVQQWKSHMAPMFPSLTITWSSAFKATPSAIKRLMKGFSSSRTWRDTLFSWPLLAMPHLLLFGGCGLLFVAYINRQRLARLRNVGSGMSSLWQSTMASPIAVFLKPRVGSLCQKVITKLHSLNFCAQVRNFFEELGTAFITTYDGYFSNVVNSLLSYSWLVISALGSGTWSLLELLISRLVFEVIPFSIVLVALVLCLLSGLSVLAGIVCACIGVLVIVCCTGVLLMVTKMGAEYAWCFGRQHLDWLRIVAKERKIAVEQQIEVAKNRKQATPKTPNQPIVQPNHFSVPYSPDGGPYAANIFRRLHETQIATQAVEGFIRSQEWPGYTLLPREEYNRLKKIDAEFRSFMNQVCNVPGYTMTEKLNEVLRQAGIRHRARVYEQKLSSRLGLEVKSLQLQLTEAQEGSDIQQLRERNVSLEALVEANKTSKDAVDVALAQERQGHAQTATQRQQLQDDCASLTNRCDDLQGQVDRLQKTAVTIEAEFRKQLAEDRTCDQGRIRALQDQLNEKDKELTLANSRREEAERQAKGLKEHQNKVMNSPTPAFIPRANLFAQQQRPVSFTAQHGGMTMSAPAASSDDENMSDVIAVGQTMGQNNGVDNQQPSEPMDCDKPPRKAAANNQTYYSQHKKPFSFGRAPVPPPSPLRQMDLAPSDSQIFAPSNKADSPMTGGGLLSLHKAASANTGFNGFDSSSNQPTPTVHGSEGAQGPEQGQSALIPGLFAAPLQPAPTTSSFAGVQVSHQVQTASSPGFSASFKQPSSSIFGFAGVPAPQQTQSASFMGLGSGSNQGSTAAPSNTPLGPVTRPDPAVMANLRAESNKFQDDLQEAARKQKEHHMEEAAKWNHVAKPTPPPAYVASNDALKQANHLAGAGTSTVQVPVVSSSSRSHPPVDENGNYSSPLFVPNMHTVTSSKAPATLSSKHAPPSSSSHSPTVPTIVPGSRNDTLLQDMMKSVMNPPVYDSSSEDEEDFEDVKLDPVRADAPSIDEVAADSEAGQQARQSVDTTLEKAKAMKSRNWTGKRLQRKRAQEDDDEERFAQSLKRIQETSTGEHVPDEQGGHLSDEHLTTQSAAATPLSQTGVNVTDASDYPQITDHKLRQSHRGRDGTYTHPVPFFDDPSEHAHEFLPYTADLLSDNPRTTNGCRNLTCTRNTPEDIPHDCVLERIMEKTLELEKKTQANELEKGKWREEKAKLQKQRELDGEIFEV